MAKNQTKQKKHGSSKRSMTRKKKGGKCSCSASFFNGGEQKKRKSGTRRVYRRKMTGGYARILLGSSLASTNSITSGLPAQPPLNSSHLPSVGPV